ncbi:MAG: ABC transporter permease [Nitrospiria bacterium]
MGNFLSDIQKYVDLIVVLTQKEMKVRYKSTFFGYLWSIGNPLAFAFVFFIAFKIVMKVQIEDYVVFLISGLFPWQWFSNSVNASPMIFLGNASIIKKVNFPRYLIPVTQVLQDMIHFILAIPVIIFFLYFYHKSPSISWIYGIPILLLVQFFITLGFSLLVSTLNLFFRDLERLTAIGMMFFFYFTPVLYLETMIPEKYRLLISLNPIAWLMISWRNLFLEGKFDISNIMISTLHSVIIFSVGYFVYRKLSWRFAELL